MDTDPWPVIDRLVDWLDEGSALPAETKTLLQILKITEEAGEVAEAVIGVTGQNPRKGFSHSWADVEHELCDVIITAMVALTRVNPRAATVFTEHLAGVAARTEQTGRGPSRPGAQAGTERAGEEPAEG